MNGIFEKDQDNNKAVRAAQRSTIELNAVASSYFIFIAAVGVLSGIVLTLTK